MLTAYFFRFQLFFLFLLLFWRLPGMVKAAIKVGVAQAKNNIRVQTRIFFQFIYNCHHIIIVITAGRIFKCNCQYYHSRFKIDFFTI